MTSDPHADASVLRHGPPPEEAARTVILLHGRGGSPHDMLGLAAHLDLPETAWLAPAAGGASWWPDSFLAPFARNEPHLSSALALMERIAKGIDGTLAVLGFSQGGCLALEAVARGVLPARAAVALSGALVGTGEPGGPGTDALYGHAPKRFDYPPLPGSPRIHIACHERDPHIPLARVRESEAVLTALGAQVSTVIHSGSGHGIVQADLVAARAMLA